MLDYTPRTLTSRHCLYTPRPAVFARPACGLRSPLAATASGQVLPPGFSTRLPELQITRRHQGFIHIRPSGLPLARSLPRTERRPLGFFPELRTPTGRTHRRTSGRGSVTNTNRELRDRHRRPPIHELTHMRDIASHPQVLIIAPDRSLRLLPVCVCTTHHAQSRGAMARFQRSDGSCRSCKSFSLAVTHGHPRSTNST